MPQAAVVRSHTSELDIETVTVAQPRTGEVQVEVVVAGVCEHDVAAVSGRVAHHLPLVPGHCGAGIVVAVGPGVMGVDEGDHVVLCGSPQCGQCFWCRRGEGALCPSGQRAATNGSMPDGSLRLSRGGEELRQFRSVGSWSSVVVVPEAVAVPIHSAVDLGVAALIDCAVLEGLGAVTRAATITPGDTVLIVGNGGVGRNAIQGARMGGAGSVIVLGEDAGPIEEDLGATHVVCQGEDTLGDMVRDLTDGRGADVIIDTQGLDGSIEQALRVSRRGGQVVVTSGASERSCFRLQAREALVDGARSLRGGLFSPPRPREDVPILIELHESGMLRLDRPICETVPLEDVGHAVGRLVDGSVQQVRVKHS